MENPEEILHSLEEFTKLRPKDIPRELEDYLCFVAKTGDPVYQWSVIKTLFREKLVNVITEFYESTCLADILDIPPCPNVDRFNYDSMKTFILEKLDTFVAAPFTVQRICELLTSPRKEYNRIDKYMRALEKNILVVSTTEPGNHRVPENGDGFVNGIETEHIQDVSNDINIEEMDDTPAWPTKTEESFQSTSKNNIVIDTFHSEESSELPDAVAQPKVESVITCCTSEETPVFVSTDPVETTLNEPKKEESVEEEKDLNGDNAPVPAIVQRRRNSIEPPVENIHETIEEKAETEKEIEVTNETEDVPTIEPETINSNETQEISQSLNVPEIDTVEENTSAIADPCDSSDVVETPEITEDLKSSVEMEVTNEPIIENISTETSIAVADNTETSDLVSNIADSATSSEIPEEPLTSKTEPETVDTKQLDTENEVEVAPESSEKVAEEVVEKVLSILSDTSKDEVPSDVQITEEQTITSTCDLIIEKPVEDNIISESNISESDIIESSSSCQEAEAKTISTLSPTTENSDNPNPMLTVETSKEIEVPIVDTPMEVDVPDNTASTETSTTTEN